MFCPVCLSYAQQVEAITVVSGTQYCAAHGVEALAADVGRPGPGRGPRVDPRFTPPVPLPLQAPSPPVAPAES